MSSATFPIDRDFTFIPMEMIFPQNAAVSFFNRLMERREWRSLKTRQASHRKEYWAFGIRSISSYSEDAEPSEKGRNKEHDRLPQVNLVLLFGEESGLPFYYRKHPGNITDVKTVKQLMAEFNVMAYKKVGVILDRSFYSKENINLLYKNYQRLSLV